MVEPDTTLPDCPFCSAGGFRELFPLDEPQEPHAACWRVPQSAEPLLGLLPIQPHLPAAGLLLPDC